MTYIPLIDLKTITSVFAFGFIACIVLGVFELAFETEEIGNQE